MNSLINDEININFLKYFIANNKNKEFIDGNFKLTVKGNEIFIHNTKYPIISDYIKEDNIIESTYDGTFHRVFLNYDDYSIKIYIHNKPSGFSINHIKESLNNNSNIVFIFYGDKKIKLSKFYY